MSHAIYRFVAVLLIPLTMLGGLPLNAQAGIIGSEQAMSTEAGDADRARLSQFLHREEVREALAAHGVDTAQAIARVHAMSDAEVARLADRIEHAPAGAGIVGTLFTVFLILLVTDILGLTAVYPFTRPIR